MPGLAGIVGEGRPRPQLLDRMVQRLAHDPAWQTGQYADDAVGACVGWVARPGAFASALPLWNRRRDALLIFVGENFMDDAEVERLAGAHARDHADPAGALMDLYDALGPRFVEHLNGWFSGVLVDLRARTATLFNDRFGLGRVYCHEADGCTYFASEAKALLAVLPATRALDDRAVAETLGVGCVLQNRTLFRGVSLLPPASRWTFAPGEGVRKERYFDPQAWEGQEPLDAPSYESEVTRTFARILPRYLRAREGVAASLTAGLDSRMIMAWAPSSPSTLPCYSFGGIYRDSIDVKVARHVARLCGQTHETIPVGTEFLGRFSDLAPRAVYLSDGTMDVTGAVEVYVNRLAAGIAPLRLTGNYGSEILRGNVAFRPGRWQHDMLRPEVRAGLLEAEATYAAERAGSALSFIAFKQVPWHHYSRLSIEQSQLGVRSPFLDNDLVALAFRAPGGRAMSNASVLRLIEQGNPALARIPNDRGDVVDPLPGLGKARRAFRSLEIRAEYAFDYGMPRWLARANGALAPLRLERMFLGRHKFYHFRAWYRDRLHGYVRDVLLDPRARQRSFFTGSALERMVRDHGRGSDNATREITRALTLELTYRTLVDA